MITGRGVYSPLGCDWPSFASAVREGAVAQAAPFPGASTNDPVFCYLLSDAEALAPLGKQEPLAALATAAARDALAEAGLQSDGSPLESGGTPFDDVGLVMNTVLGPSTAVEGYLERLQNKGPRAARPGQFVDSLLSMPASRVGIELQLRGSTAVLGGSSSFELALDWVRQGRAPAVVAGGAEYQSPKCLRYHGALAQRSGAERSLLGQGAAFIVLEAAEHARSRGAHPCAELLGAGAAGEPQAVSVPWPADPRGRAFVAAMRAALKDAGLAPPDIDIVVLAAADDASEEGELAALRAVFNGTGETPALLRPKRLLGETLGAGGAIGLLTALAAAGEGEARGTSTALVNAFEMGGSVSSLVVRASS